MHERRQRDYPWTGKRRRMSQAIKRGIIQSFSASTYTASVLLLEATSTALASVPVSNTVDSTSCLPGALCAVLFFDEHNPLDAVVIAVFANGGGALPAPPPGRVTISSPVQQLSGVTISVGATQMFTLSNIPAGTLAVLCKAYFSTPAPPAHIDLAAHGGNLGEALTIGDNQSATGYLNGGGILPVDSQGRIDIKANGGACTVWLFTYGYVM
ncbi:MAG TPA: hypothetical protein VKV40_01375 [Ktedonobacteraceae bacterium]|nr:hypothetical protein [Ktedonobacteraceae bacterium]